MLRENTEIDELSCMKRNTSVTATALLTVGMISKRVVRFITLGKTNALLNYGCSINIVLYRAVQGKLASARADMLMEELGVTE